MQSSVKLFFHVFKFKLVVEAGCSGFASSRVAGFFFFNTNKMS